MRSALVLAVLSLGCAGGEAPPETTADAGRDTAVAVDSSAPRDTSLGEGGVDAIFPVEEVGPTGLCAIPSGTTATASASYMSGPEMVVDGNLSTVWNSGGYAGWVRLKFPTPALFDRVRIAGNAVPACDHVYTINGVTGGGETNIATATRSVTTEVQWLPVIEVTRGTYDELFIEVAPTLSWIALSEITVFDSTAGCP